MIASKSSLTDANEPETVQTRRLQLSARRLHALLLQQLHLQLQLNSYHENHLKLIEKKALYTKTDCKLRPHLLGSFLRSQPSSSELPNERTQQILQQLMMPTAKVEQLRAFWREYDRFLELKRCLNERLNEMNHERIAKPRKLAEQVVFFQKLGDNKTKDAPASKQNNNNTILIDREILDFYENLLETKYRKCQQS